MTGLREGWGVKVWTLGGLEVWTGLTLRGYHKGHEGPQRGTKEGNAGGGPCVRARRTSGPGACKGMAGFARHALVLGSPSGEAASYMSYWSYMSYRGVYQSANQLISQSAGRVSALWHVADVPGVQGLWEAWKFRGLEACRPAGALSVHCSLFSVL